MIDGKIIKIMCGQADKYGRVLGTIQAQSASGLFNVNQYLINHMMAKPYQGGKKK